MPISTGFNHIGTLTTEMKRSVRFYEEAFGAVVRAEIPPSDDHPWMKVVDIGGGAALNIFEVPADDIIGERRRQGHRGAVDHFAFAVDSRATLEKMKERLAARARARSGQCPTARSWVFTLLSGSRRDGTRGVQSSLLICSSPLPIPSMESHLGGPPVSVQLVGQTFTRTIP